ncbi:rhomboid-related protein 2-like [Thrips palmi]|uniref:Rhomboid-related protein 2-like n=1 Tax=Thrips palmi TaxID=161013 RepID=A0A6P8Y876_THRPL|nr:rhomboid-related protein 2-like [Thrips palmi]XP_034235833.1 rhomboid-related protein 2-like [Thrips palmi]XP_034235834.1 rhomboid-related protein 2-like [Thrips palmi]
MTSSGDVNGQTAINMGHLYPHWQMIFNKYDEDADGRLSLAEMKRVVKSESFEQDIPNRCIKRIVAQADENKDGYIEYEEFLKMIQEPEVRTVFGQGLQTFVRKTIVPRRPPPSVQRATDTTDYAVQRAMDNIDAGEYEDEYTCNPPAVCMIIVSIIEIIAFLYDVVETGRSTVSGPAAKLFIYNPRERSQAWRYFTYMFVHVGVFHLAVNLMVQIMLGIPLEMVHRWWRVLLIYLAGVVAGSLGTSVSDPNVYLAGASGGVYAIMTAHIATIIMNFQEMQFAVYQLIVFLLLIVSDVGTAIYNRLHEVDDKVGYVAHLAGAIAGLLVGIQVLRNLEVRSWERVIWWASIILYLGLMTAAIVWNIAFPDYFPGPYECYGVGC